MWHSLANVTRGSIIDVAGIPDTPLKLVTIRKTSKTIFLGGIFPGGPFPGGGQIFYVHFSGGLFTREHFSGHREMVHGLTQKHTLSMKRFLIMTSGKKLIASTKPYWAFYNSSSFKRLAPFYLWTPET